MADADATSKAQEMFTAKYGGRMMTLTKVSSRMFGMIIPFTFIVVGAVLSNPSELNENNFRVFCMMGVGLVVAVSLLPLHCAERVQREQRIKGFYCCSCLLSAVHLLLLLLYGFPLLVCYHIHFTWHGCGASQCVPPSMALSEALTRPDMEMMMLDCFAKGAWPDYEQHFPNNEVYPSRCLIDSGGPFHFMKLKGDIEKKSHTAPAGPPPTWDQVQKLGVNAGRMEFHDFIEHNTWPFGLVLFLTSFHCALLAMSCFAVRAGHTVHQAQTKEVEIEMALVGSAVSTP